jgi:large subunit ribosomal protein L6
MRKLYSLGVDVPEGVHVKVSDRSVELKKGSVDLKKDFRILGTEIKSENGKISFVCKKANKKNIADIKAAVAHVKNMLVGLNEKYVYKLEICHVHFPMTCKVDGKKFVISNFLGEKKNRTAEILDGVNVEIKTNLITVSSHDLEKAGQTAANLEVASKVRNRDRRVFQDGIFITEKPGRNE